MSMGYLALAKRVKNCPLHLKQGDRMFFVLPGMGKEESDQICALAAVDLIPVIQRMEKVVENAPKAKEIGRSNFCTGCKGQNAFVEFEVSRVAAATLAGDTGAISDPNFLEMLKSLKEFKLFAPLPTRSLVRILPCVKTKELEEGDIVMRKGERGQNLFLLADGAVEVVTLDANGVETVIATLGKGEVLGEMSLLTGEPVAATIRCTGSTRFLTIEKHDFDHLLSSNPALNIYFTRLLADRLKTTSKRFINEIEKGVLGYLNMIGAPELMQALQGTARSGVLHAKEEDKAIEMYLHEGHLYRITPLGRSNKDPEEAFYDFLGW
ncbi:MAG TPA: cyclic nucleotide-binding domain-containing protein, partial [Planctomycetota bacterium]|nr:cyclic nucleotide-binding domain-containing protein [Planctomycetota bacterium]